MSDSGIAGKIRTDDGCDIAYKLYGNGTRTARRVVFIHALGFSGDMWRDVAVRLSNEAEVLTYDCRGHGKSGRVTDVFTFERFADDLAQLMDGVQWPKAAIVGCSMGGSVALGFAQRHPTRMTALGLISTTSWYGNDAPRHWRDRAATAREKGLAGMVDFQLTRWFSDAFRAEHPEVARAASEILLANDLQGYSAACIMLGDTDFRALLPNIKVATAISVGDQDYATPVSMSRLMHDAIPGSTLTTFPGARHITPVERADDVASEVRKLLARAHE